MQNIILFDPVKAREALLPLTYTRPVAMIRHGITTMLEKWQDAIEGTYSFETQDYLSMKYPISLSADGDDLYIAANLHPDAQLVEAILALAPGTSLTPTVPFPAPEKPDMTIRNPFSILHHLFYILYLFSHLFNVGLELNSNIRYL